MLATSLAFPEKQLKKTGLTLDNTIHYQLPQEQLVFHALERNKGSLNDTGALVIHTGKFTGRSPRDKFIVNDPVPISIGSRDSAVAIDWNDFNIPLAEHYFDRIYEDLVAYLNTRNELWIRDAYACAAPGYRLNIRVVNELPWMNLFVYNMFLRPTAAELESVEPDWHILSAPGLQLDAARCGTRQGNATVISFKHRVILIAGSGYTGEIKKGIFTILNYLLPVKRGVLSMHCAANMSADGDTALFFGLSGTGKTTLSTDPDRKLIGDDEHGWDDEKVFNFEGGCYAKCINLSEEKEPEIYQAIRPGALVENVTFYEGENRINYADDSITENTRVSYPISFVKHAAMPSIGNMPRHIFFLTCDAYGVLPPVARLNNLQVLYYFISGYTAKIAGTEAGVTTPKATFSACFGAPFIPLHPAKYAAMLGDKIAAQGVNVWMVNTGWTGGAYGTGSRMKLSDSRAIIRAVLSGALNEVNYQPDPVFGLMIPDSCPGVTGDVLIPRNTWQDVAAYDKQAAQLARLFAQNFEKYKGVVDDAVILSGPDVSLV